MADEDDEPDAGPAEPGERLDPRQNGDLTGHAEAERLLLEAWNGGRLHHAWLLTGRSGTGKATLAYRFARFVLAQAGAPASDMFGPVTPSSLHVAPDSPVFRRIAAAGHADLMVVARQFDEKRGKYKSEVGVDQIRAVGQFLHLTASEGGWRIVILDPIDDLNTNAANALLKILEEPPKRALLLLVSHAPGGLLPTIRSRCRRLPLEPLSDADLAGVLARQRPDIGEPNRSALVRLAEGSAGRALMLADQDGLELYRTMLGLLAELPRPEPAALHQFAERLGRATGQDAYASFAEIYPWWLSRLARATARGAAVPEVMPGEGEVGARLVRLVGLDRVVEVWENTIQLLARADGLNLDRKQVVLDAFLAFAGPAHR